MKRINCREAAMEGVITRHGTLVGPLMTELTGFPELTPYGGGWCGNDVFAAALSEKHRGRPASTRSDGRAASPGGLPRLLRARLPRRHGRGEMYLGELNPRITGASSMTNVTAVAYGDMPLFLFHLLEFLDVDYEIDVDALNAGWAQPSAIDAWSQFILKDTADKVGADHRSATARASGGSTRRRTAASRFVRARDRLAHGRRRGRGVLPANRPGGWLPLPGRRHRHPRHAGPTADRRARAHRRARTWITGSSASSLTAPLTTAARRRSASPALLLQDAVMTTAMLRGDRGARSRAALGALFAAALASLPSLVPAGGRGGADVVRRLAAGCSVSTCPSSSPTYERCASSPVAVTWRRASSAMWEPPSYLSGCSQGVWRAGDPVLARNYDYAPERLEGAILHTNVDRARDRHERLPVGAPRRRQRCGARGVARVRRPQDRRQRLWRAARGQVSARDV